MTQLETLLIQQLKELTAQFNQQSNQSEKQFEDLRNQLNKTTQQLAETNQRLTTMTKNYQGLQTQLTQLLETEKELLRELRL